MGKLALHYEYTWKNVPLNEIDTTWLFFYCNGRLDHSQLCFIFVVCFRIIAEVAAFKQFEMVKSSLAEDWPY